MRDARPASAHRPPAWPGPLVAALLVIAAAALCAVTAMRAGLGFLSGLDVRRPPLADRSIELEPAGPRRARRLVLVILDGLGADRARDLPAIDRLRRAGASGVARSHLPSLSRPAQAAIVTGVPPRHSGVRSNDYRWPVPVDSVLARARAAGLATALVTDDATGFAAMFARHLDQTVVAPWARGGRRAVARALARGDALVVVILSQVDDAGHRSGAASQEYAAAARSADAAVGEIAEALDLSRDAIIVTADHGHTGGGGHGGSEPAVMQVPLVLAGAGVRAGARLARGRLVDIAPTAAALLGLPPPGHALGRTLTSALRVDGVGGAALARVDQVRRARLLAGLRELGGDGVRAGWLVALVLLAALMAAACGRRLDRRAALVARSGFGAAVLALVVVTCHGRLSLSTLASHAEVERHLVAACAVLTVAWWTAALVALRGERTTADRLSSAWRLAATGLCGSIAAIAAVEIPLALAGLGLPPPPLLLLVPILRMSLAAYAVAAAAALLAEVALAAASSAVARRLADRPFAAR